LRAGAQVGVQVGQLLGHRGTVVMMLPTILCHPVLRRAVKGRGQMGARPMNSRALTYICLRVRYNPAVSL